MSEPFPWADVMRFGFGTLRLSSAEFWQMTIPEIQAAASAHAPLAASPIDRPDLEALLRQYPDKEG